LLLRYYDLYQRLQLHFYVLLMMGTAAISVDSTESCNYSQVLMMMGENIARNM